MLLYAYITLYEHWIAKFGLPDILVTTNGPQTNKNRTIILCHLYHSKHKPRTSPDSWTNGLREGVNRAHSKSFLRFIVNGNDL